MITQILGFLSAPVSQFLKNRGDIKNAKHVRNLAVINNQARLASSTAEYNNNWEMASLQDKDKGLRWISFSLFTAPILIVVIDPVYGGEVLARLEVLPEWMMTVWFYMVAGIWGVATLKDSVPQLIAGFRKNK